MNSIVPLLLVVLMIYAVVRSKKKLRTALYGLLTLVVTIGVLLGLTELLKLNSEIMGHVTFGVMLVITAYVMWTHARFTEKSSPTPSSSDRRDDETSGSR
jgi:predicted RND superfamily exporter protein